MSEPTERDEKLAAEALGEVIQDALRGGDAHSQEDIIAARLATARAEGKAEAVRRVREWTADPWNFAEWPDGVRALVKILDEIEGKK